MINCFSSLCLIFCNGHIFVSYKKLLDFNSFAALLVCIVKQVFNPVIKKSFTGLYTCACSLFFLIELAFKYNSPASKNRKIFSSNLLMDRHCKEKLTSC